MKEEYIDQYGLDSLPHLIEAVQCGCLWFVTNNKAMLKDRAELEAEFKIKIRTPKEMSEERQDVQG